MLCILGLIEACVYVVAVILPQKGLVGPMHVLVMLWPCCRYHGASQVPGLAPPQAAVQRPPAHAAAGHRQTRIRCPCGMNSERGRMIQCQVSRCMCPAAGCRMLDLPAGILVTVGAASCEDSRHACAV